MPSLHIQKNDIVQVITGTGSGSKKQGRVLRVYPEKNALLVEHVRVVKKTVSSKSGRAPRAASPSRKRPSTSRM
jgi:large subunit ribosomal protein L24